MTIGQTWFWIDRNRHSIGIRSANRRNYTHPFEGYLNKRAQLIPDLHVYETTDESGLELRLSFRWLWLCLNVLICLLPERENGQRFDDRDRDWGVTYLDGSVRFTWGHWHHYWELPFINRVVLARQILQPTTLEVVYEEPKGKRMMDYYDEKQAAEKEHTFHTGYRYVCKSGEVQEVIAAVVVHRDVCRRKWLPFRYHTDSIWVTFSEEVGEGRGSWKGGVTGCGYTIAKGESAYGCLHRMERERRFAR